MKRTLSLVFAIILCLVLCACGGKSNHATVAATTLPVYDFTRSLCKGTDIGVTRLITENVSCLHDYTLQVQQMRAIENASLVVVSSAEYESFITDALSDDKKILDASEGILLMDNCNTNSHGHDHGHEYDPHIWLSPSNAKIMAENISAKLIATYPEHSGMISENLSVLLKELDALSAYAKTQLEDISCTDIITFHDGFAYMADAFGLNILHSIEEESGAEASAAELISIINKVRQNQLPAIFTELNGSTSAAEIISRETGVNIFALDMAVSGDSYFKAMFHNIDTLKEALE